MINGVVTASATEVPIAKVTISGTPYALRGESAGDGTFGWDHLMLGAYTLTFTRAGYVDTVVPGVSVGLGGPTHVAISMATDPSSGGPVVVVSDALSAGFDQDVQVKASITDSDTDVARLTVKWSQVGGRQVAWSGDGTSTLSLHTLSFAQAKPKPDGRFGGLGFSPDETGNYDFSITVSDPEGHVTSAVVHVAATPPTSPLANVPLGIPAWFQGDGAPQASWSWSLDTSLVQGGSHASLAGQNSQFPSFVPDAPGTYKLVESVSGKTLNVHAGSWVGVAGSTATCASCHDGSRAPDKFTPWQKTLHASTFSRGLDGALGAGFKPECTGCHAVGVSTAATNGGFDDVMSRVGWSWPSTLAAGNADALAKAQPDLARLGGVQCESCHGPQFSDAHPFDKSARVSWSADVCATCHESAPDYYKGSQWRASKHADLSLPRQVGTIEARPGGGAAHCGRCHTAQGYTRYVGQLASGYTGNLTKDGKPLAADNSNAADDAWLGSLGLTKASVQPQVCVACHDPHDATLPHQLRIYDGAPGGLPSGQGAVASVGSGIVCMACHNSRNGEHDDFTPPPAAIAGPHDGPQTDVLYGFNAYFVPRFTLSPHLAVKDTCVGCHNRAPTAAQKAAHQTANHSFSADVTICGNCHASDMNGAALQATIETHMNDLDLAIYGKVTSALAAAATSYGSYKVRIVDPATGYTSSWVASGTAPSSVALAAAPVSVTRPLPVPQHGGLGTLVFTMAAPVTFEAYDAAGVDKGQLSLTTFNVSLSGVQANGSAVFPGSSVIAKAIWNEQLLHNDGTKGIHNLPFYEAVLSATIARLQALP